MLVFYGSTILWVIAALIGTALGEGPMHVVIYAWVRFHRWCARWILGITVCIEGGYPTANICSRPSIRRCLRRSISSICSIRQRRF